jgi:hypothetical protein
VRGSKAKVKSTDGGKSLAIPSGKDLTRALEKAAAGDAQAVGELRKLYDESPAFWRLMGDLARQVEDGILGRFYDKVIGEAVRRKLTEMREELGHEAAGELERLLIERVVVTWLRVQHAEHMKTANMKEDTPLRTTLALDRLLGTAHRNFLSACKTLAQVRRLLRPKVAQVNIGAQQVNVGQMDGGRQ